MPAGLQNPAVVTDYRTSFHPSVIRLGSHRGVGPRQPCAGHRARLLPAALQCFRPGLPPSFPAAASTLRPDGRGHFLFLCLAPGLAHSRHSVNVRRTRGIHLTDSGCPGGTNLRLPRASLFQGIQAESRNRGFNGDEDVSLRRQALENARAPCPRLLRQQADPPGRSQQPPAPAPSGERNSVPLGEEPSSWDGEHGALAQRGLFQGHACGCVFSPGSVLQTWTNIDSSQA